ncbi:protein kinase [candidate division KSB1 bacterium]|nr:protein kinase [candidate division KSB1 bacterium]
MLRARSWGLGAGILLLAYVILPAVYSPARAQKSGDAKKAQSLYEKALQKKSVAERIHLLEQAAQLVAEAQSSISSPEIARQAANIHGALGREFYQKARWQTAITHLEKALALDSGLLPARATLGLAYFQQGQYDAAIQAYDLVLRAQPNAQLYNNLGAAHEAKGDLDAAVAAYSRALELDASLGLAQKNLLRVQAKLSRIAARAAVSSDSIQLAAKALDSLAVATAISRQDDAKTKTTNNSSTAPASSPHPSRQAAVTTQRAPKPAVLKKAALKSSKSPLLKNSTRDSAAAQIQSTSSTGALKSPEATISRSPQPSVALSPPPSVTVESLETSNPRTSTPSAGSSSITLVVFGISALLLAVFAVIQRRRLGHVWLQLKPALAASTAVVSRQVRLLPSRMRNELVVRYEHTRRIKLLPAPTNGALAGAPLETESSEPIPVSKNTPEEPHQPSLQTQAFFAEIIAAEPEIEEFDEEVLTKFDDAASLANGHVDHASAEPSLLPIVVDISKDADLGRLSLEPIDPAAEKNEHNGEFVMSSTTPKSGLAIDSTNEERNGIDSNIGYAFSINLGEEPDPAPSSSSRNAAEIPLQQDNQSKHNEDPASAGPPVLGRYVIERKIGKGAMGNIYLALDPKLDRRVVIKTVCFNLATSETDTLTLKDRVYREARAIAKLGHPNIVVVYDVEDDKDMSYIVMEHIEGRDLRQALASEHRFDAARAIKIVSQVCGALDYAHQAGIIHRDIKPSNIMLLPGDKAKVTDFGIAKIADNFSLTLPGHVLGTPSYMAPEQFEGMEIDGRADIFSLGVVFYELVTGCRPFAGNTLASLAYKIVHKMHIPPSLQNVELPLEIDEIVGRALAKTPEERYATAMEFREALQALPAEAAHGEVELAH